MNLKIVPHGRFSGHHVINEVFERVLVDLRTLLPIGVARSYVLVAFNVVCIRVGLTSVYYFSESHFTIAKTILLRTMIHPTNSSFSGINTQFTTERVTQILGCTWYLLNHGFLSPLWKYYNEVCYFQTVFDTIIQ